MARDEFSPLNKQRLKDRVGSHCSNPDCDVLTIAASDESNSSVNNTGIAAHICAAASGKGARRYKPEPEMTSKQRSSIDNGIWLCASCATMIDRDEVTYTEALLQQWKTQAEKKAKSRLGQKLYSQAEIEAIVAVEAKQRHLDSEQNKVLLAALTALSQKGEIGTAAIEAFQQNNPSLAKDLFKLEAQRAEMAAKQGAKAYRHLGAIAFLDNTQETLDAYQRATELDPDNAEGWNQLGVLLNHTHNLNQALIAFQKVLALGETHNNQDEISMACFNLSTVYQSLGEFSKSIEIANKGLVIDEALGNTKEMAHHYGNLGFSYQMQRNFGKSNEMYDKSLAIYEALNDKEGISNTFKRIGHWFDALRLFDKATEMYNKSLVIDKEIDDKKGMAINYGNLGTVYYARGDLDKAVEMYQKSLEITESLSMKDVSANQYFNVGVVYKQKGNKAEAKRYWQKSIKLYKDIGSPKAEVVQKALDSLK